MIYFVGGYFHFLRTNRCPGYQWKLCYPWGLISVLIRLPSSALLKGFCYKHTRVSNHQPLSEQSVFSYRGCYLITLDWSLERFLETVDYTLVVTVKAQPMSNGLLIIMFTHHMNHDSSIHPIFSVMANQTALLCWFMGSNHSVIAGMDTDIHTHILCIASVAIQSSLNVVKIHKPIPTFWSLQRICQHTLTIYEGWLTLFDSNGFHSLQVSGEGYFRHSSCWLHPVTRVAALVMSQMGFSIWTLYNWWFVSQSS